MRGIDADARAADVFTPAQETREMRKIHLASAVALVLALSVGAAQVSAQNRSDPGFAPLAPANDALVDEFTRVEAASVADAIEQLYGVRAYLPHQFRPVEGAKFAGRAVTVQLKREEHKEGSPAQQGMIDTIDDGAPGSVYVMAMDGAEDFAGIGGLMSTTMKSRGFVGAIVDGGVRDLPQIAKLRFPVFARSIVPSTTVNHFRFAGANVPVTIGGVRVEAGDIIVADLDGVVVVPKARAAAVLKKAQELDNSEHQMIPFIEKYRSLREAVAKFGRL
jgi:4-hydroxy-4-methyl-2-oxoglutarate aldolase